MFKKIIDSLFNKKISNDTRIPERICIKHDDYEAKYIGRTASGDQFFITISFNPATEDSDREEFLCLYQFDKQGSFIRSDMESLKSDLSQEGVDKKRGDLLSSLGKVDFCDIKIKPFTIDDHNGTKFGLIPAFDEEGGDVWLEMQPGNYMAFFPPWDGEYDT